MLHKQELINPSLVQSYRQIAQRMGIVVLCIGIAVILGWFLDISVLKSVFPGLATMKFNTALLFVLTGTSLATIRLSGKRLHLWLGMAVVIIAGATLTLSILGRGAFIDEIIAKDDETLAPDLPGRMAVMTAVNFVLLGCSILLMKRHLIAAQLLTVLVAFISIVALVGYIYNEQSLYRIEPYSSMALHTALNFTLLSVGILMANPNCTLLSVTVSDSIGGVITRRLVLPAVLGPLVIGSAVIEGIRQGFYSFEFGFALATVIYILLLTLVIRVVGGYLHRVDLERIAAKQERQRVIEEMEVRISDRTPELTRAYETLQTSEKTFRGLLESAPDAMVITDRSGDIVLVNAQAQKLFGYTAEEMVGQRVEMLVPAPYQQRHGAHRQDYFVDPAPRPMGVGLDLHAVRKNGDEFPVEISLSPLETESGILISSTIRDVTLQKDVERRLVDERNLLRTVIDIIPDFIFVKDTESNLTLANHAVVRDHNAETLAEVIGKSDFDVLPKEQAEQYYEQEQELLRTGESIINFEAPITVQGVERWVLSNKVPLKDSNGTIIGLVGINRDVTTRRQAEEEIRDLNVRLEKQVHQRTQQLRQMEALNKELEAFSYSVSHDLRAPLRALDGFSQALLEDYYENLDEQGKEYLVLIRYESQRMAELIDGLLTLSQVTRAELGWQLVNLSTLAREITKEFKRQEPHRAVKFDIKDTPPACGDERLLRVALQNLIGNAWKYSSKKPTAQIAFGSQQEHGQTVYIVQDNGAGFDMAYSNKLFGAFQRLHHKSQFEGTGIGLATVQRIIHRHGGTIQAKSEPDAGATFSFTLSTENCE